MRFSDSVIGQFDVDWAGGAELPEDAEPRIDRDTAILYAYSVWDDAAKAAFLFTVKFDAGGRPKIVKTYRMSEKESEEQQ